MPISYREHAVLGRTGLRVSRLGIGAGYGAPAEAYEHAFHDYGVNYMYWSLTRRGGMKRALLNLAPKFRDRLVIAVQTYDHAGVVARNTVERHLRALRIDYADVLILGWFNHGPPRRVIDAALKLKDQGKIRFIAMSGHRRPLFAQHAQDPASPIDIFMIRYNAAHPGAERDVFPFLPASNRPGVYTYTTTSWGQLLEAKRMPPGEPPMTSTECYRFALANENVNMCLCGPKSMEEMRAALATLDAAPASAVELARWRRIGAHVHPKGVVPAQAAG